MKLMAGRHASAGRRRYARRRYGAKKRSGENREGMSTWLAAKSLFVPLLFGLMANGTLVRAQPAQVDWKLYGGTADSWCFYDANSTERQPDRHIRTWAKCLAAKSINALLDGQSELEDKIIENSARKMHYVYIPPFASVERMNEDQVASVITFEETADIARIEPIGKFLYELDCSGKLRILSIEVVVAGQRGFDDKPHDWAYIAPESNGRRLQTLVCQ